MSTSIGTLQQGARFKVWPVAVALLAITALAVYFTTADRDKAAPAATSTVTGTAANTPAELSGGLFAPIPDTLANTPSELRGGFTEVAADTVPAQIGRRNVTPRVASEVANANTPSEITGGMVVGGDGPARFHPLP